MSLLSSAVLSLILMVVIRYISMLLVWILTAVVVVGSIGEALVSHWNKLNDQHWLSLAKSCCVCGRWSWYFVVAVRGSRESSERHSTGSWTGGCQRQPTSPAHLRHRCHCFHGINWGYTWNRKLLYDCQMQIFNVHIITVYLRWFCSCWCSSWGSVWRSPSLCSMWPGKCSPICPC